MEDPFFVVKDEVFKALNNARGLYLRWRELNEGSASPELSWTATELRNSLRSIEWDLEDLDDTIGIVEKNPTKFKIDKRELATRRAFIESTRDEVKSMKEKMSLNRIRDSDITARQPLLDNSASLSHSIHINNLNNTNSSGGGIMNVSGSGFRHSGTKYSKLENALDSPSHRGGDGGGGPGGGGTMDSPSHRFMGEQMSVQQQMFQSQDEQLDVISDSIGTLKTVSRQINVEIDEQAVMLDDFSHELENTGSKMDSTMKKVAKLMHVTNDKRQWMTIGILTALLVILLIIVMVS